MASDLPPPPLPPDIDFSKIDGFFLDTVKLLGSELVILSTGDEFKAAVLLWCHAWKQSPACSLPDDDRLLAGFARVAPARWRKLRAMALRGFVKCADGRLYHRVLAGDAMRAWDAVQRQRARTRAATEARRKATPHDHRDDHRDDRRDGHHGTVRDGTRLNDSAVTESAHPPPAAQVAAAFAAKHRALWPDFEAFRQLRRWPGQLLPDIQGWLDRGLSAAHLAATLSAAPERWRGDAEPPKGIRPFQRELDEAVALARAGGGLTAAEDARLAYLGAFVAQRGRDDAHGPAWFPEWGAPPASLDAARAEHAALAAKRAGMRDGMREGAAA
jgi:uncharacterized protein YdaU (DUF1376 family)